MKLEKGQTVLFGRKQGEKTLGEVIKVNLKSVKVKQLEARGAVKNHPIGTIWRVAPIFCTVVEG